MLSPEVNSCEKSKAYLGTAVYVGILLPGFSGTLPLIHKNNPALEVLNSATFNSESKFYEILH